MSAVTVSRALSAPERVSGAMRERVETAVHETGYTLNQSARSLRSRTTKTILVTLPNVLNPFFSPTLDAVEHEAADRGSRSRPHGMSHGRLSFDGPSGRRRRIVRPGREPKFKPGMADKQRRLH